MFRQPIPLFLVFIVICFGCSDRGRSTREFAERSVTVDGKVYGFRVFVPNQREPNERLPVMLYLHGSGSRGDDNITPAESFRSAVAAIKDKINFIVVIPQCRNGTFWAASEMAKYSIAALDQSVKEFNGDDQELYLAGFSLGGYGTWQIAAAYPGKFAALVPVAGGVVGERPIEPRDREAIIPEVGAMLDSPEPYKAIATAIGPTPAWVFHGTIDELVPVEFSRKIVNALREQGNKNTKFTEYEKDGHMIFSKAFSEPGIFEWLGQQRLKN